MYSTVPEWDPPPPPDHIVMRLVGWNAVLLVAGLALVVLTGEAWLRSTVPFRTSHRPTVFVPGVGILLRPDTEVRWTTAMFTPKRSELAGGNC